MSYPANQSSSNYVKLVGDAAVIIPVVGVAITALTNIFGNIKGKTPHLGWANTNTIVTPVAKAIDSLISDNLSSSDYQEINSMSFANEVINEIRNCGWWKVGNDVEQAVSNDQPAGELWETIWRVLLWGMDNSPLGNYSDGYNAITEIFNNTLYAFLDSKDKQELSAATDAMIAQMCSHTPAIYNTNTVSSSVIDKVNSLLGIHSSGVSVNGVSTSQKKTSSLFVFFSASKEACSLCQTKDPLTTPIR